MKKLEKLQLHDLKEIGADEQKTMYGGGQWILGPDGQYYWYVGEVEVAAYQNIECPRCEQNAEYGIVNDLINGTENQKFFLNTVREFLGNTVPHYLGISGHINDDYTIYRYRLDGSEWTLWGSGY
jgi:hypothetical protein